MEVKLSLEPFPASTTALTGGGYAEVTVEIYVDSNLPRTEQLLTAFHETIEGFVGNTWPHEAIEVLSEALCAVKDQLEDTWK